MRLHGEVLRAACCKYQGIRNWGQGFLERLGIMTAYAVIFIDAAMHVAVVEAERRKLRMRWCVEEFIVCERLPCMRAWRTFVLGVTEPGANMCL